MSLWANSHRPLSIHRLGNSRHAQPEYTFNPEALFCQFWRQQTKSRTYQKEVGLFLKVLKIHVKQQRIVDFFVHIMSDRDRCKGEGPGTTFIVI